MQVPQIKLPVIKQISPVLVAPIIGEVKDCNYFRKKHWPHQLRVNHPPTQVERWCYEHFRSRNWRNYSTFFAFKRKEDFEWFVLRWS